MSTYHEAVQRTPMPTLVDLGGWDDVVSLREDAYELVDGVPTMAAAESNFNRSIGALLATMLNNRRSGWVAGQDVDLTIAEVPRPTVRRPDVVVMTRQGAARDRGGRPARRLLASEALLVAEIVSPSSVERDLVAKRREYALAGVPAYLVIDCRYEPGELTLFTERHPDGSFVDVAPAQHVTLTVAGVPIPVAVHDLLP